MKRLFVLCALLAAGCASHPTTGTVDIARLTKYWPKFQNYNNQLNADVAVVTNSNVSPTDKQRETQALLKRYGNLQAEITSDVRDAATTVAARRGIALVVTREFVGYGGVDLTPDIEHELHIEETGPAGASYTPGHPGIGTGAVASQSPSATPPSASPTPTATSSSK